MWTTNAETRSPIRTCVGCRTRRPRAELVRCVIGPDGRARIGSHDPGRGAWLCGTECLDAAVRRRGFDRAWRRPAPDSVVEDLQHAFDATDSDHPPHVMAVASGSTRHETLTTRAKG